MNLRKLKQGMAVLALYFFKYTCMYISNYRTEQNVHVHVPTEDLTDVSDGSTQEPGIVT